MSSSKKDDDKQPRKAKNDKPSKQQTPSSGQEENGEIKKKVSKEGFSILSSLAKFMSREKPTSAPQLKTVPETKEESESGLQVPSYNEVSSQTSELSIRRSSTLNAVSKAVNALKEVRRRVTVMAKAKQSTETLHSEETQTSNSLLSIDITHDPHLLLKNKSMHVQGTMRSLSASEPTRTTSEVNKHHSHQRSANYLEEANAPTKGPSKRTGIGSVENLSNNDSFDSSEVLFQSTPKSGKGKGNGTNKHFPLRASSKNVNFQTEPEMEMKGTQTILSRTINNTNVDHSGIDNSLARKILHDREKCSKCDLFELMFLHGGEKVMNDEEMLGMFKRHMNSHLLKAQADLNKPYKLPGKVADTEDVTHEWSWFGRNMGSDDRQRARDMTVRTNDDTSNNIDEKKFHEDEVTSMAPKIELGKLLSSWSVHADNDETGTRIEENADHFSETKEVRRKRDTSRPRQSRALSPSFERILKDYLSSKKGNCSEEVIIQRKHCHSPGYNRHDSFIDYDDGYYYSGNGGSERRKSDKRYHRNIERDCFSDDKNYCFCKRLNHLPDSHLINSCDWNTNKCDAYNYECSSTNFPEYCNDSTQQGDLSEIESQLKWFIKGMITALNGAQDVNLVGESNRSKSRGPVSNPPYEGKPAEASNDLSGPKKAENFPTGSEAKAEKQLSANPPVEDNENSRASAGKDEKREGSVLSSIALFMVKEEIKNPSNDDQSKAAAKPESSSVKQDMRKEVNSGQDAQTGFSSPFLGANKLKSGNNSIQNGRGESKNGLVHKNFHLSDSKVQELAQQILSAFCTEFTGHEGSSLADGCEGPFELKSCSVANSDEIIQQACSIFKAKITKARASTRDPQNADENDRNQGTRSSDQHHNNAACSYYYPFSNETTASDACSRVYGSNVTKSCVRQRHNNDCICCQLPLQEAFRRYNTECYRRVKTRQECISNCRRERECEQRQCRQSPVKAFTNSWRSYTAATRPRGNIFCGCNINTPTARDACEGFTYVVPQSQMYWRYM